MDLFQYQEDILKEKEAPLAYRMAPKTLDEFFGQEHIIGRGKLLRRAIEADKMGSLIFYGPPGTGKTALARIISQTTKSYFEKLNAVTSGVADLREVIKNAKERLGMYGTKTILFIDEIHRFNKSQQDAILPYVEDGTVTLIGATTENPFFEVNSALISRSRIFEFKPLTIEDLRNIIKRALTDKENGLKIYSPVMDEVTMNYLADLSGGDARNLLNALELAVMTTPPDEFGRRIINIDTVEESIQKRTIKYDKKGDTHYDVISAFIKSMRGSDPDAAVYWLGRMIYGGEDPKFIARRIVICAAEDVGLADPMALVVANSAAQAVQFIGMPEGRIILSEAAIYVASAEKSNASYMAINKAMSYIESNPLGEVPIHLKDASYKGSSKLGRGIGYQYPHDYPNAYVDQQYLPDVLYEVNQRFYEPKVYGKEKEIQNRLRRLRPSDERERTERDTSFEGNSSTKKEHAD